MECVNLLEVLGFQQRQDVVSEDEGLQVLMTIPQNEVMDQCPRLIKVNEVVSNILATKSIKALTNHFDT